ncbi:unnamed protein product [Dicrocoelium dendriticum]|nr:unnamed protein product [Dicrocoelium dendriticum]
MCGIPMCLFGIISAAKKSRQLLVVFNETFRQLLKKSMDYYVDEDSDNAYTVLGDYIMMTHQCCGFNGGEDFKNSKFFKRKNTNATIEMPFNYPSACCKPVNNSQELAACKINPTTENSNIAVGCWQAFRQQLADNLRVVMYTWIAIIGVQVISLFACILALVIDIRGEAYMYTFGNEAWADVVSL